MISRRYSLGQGVSGHISRPLTRGVSSSSSSAPYDLIRKSQSLDSNDHHQVIDWIDWNLQNMIKSGISDSDNEITCGGYNRSSEDDLKLGAEAILSDYDTTVPPQKDTQSRAFPMLRSQESESSWTSNLTGSSHNSKYMPGGLSLYSTGSSLTRGQLRSLFEQDLKTEWTENGVNLKTLRSFSQLGSIANVDGVYSALDSLPMTATDILYNLGFASTESQSSVPPRFFGPTNADLGSWSGNVFWSDQTTPISNFDYLFNMMDDTPAMEDETVEETDGSFKSAFTSRADSTGSGSSYGSSSPHNNAASCRNTSPSSPSTNNSGVLARRNKPKNNGRPKFKRSNSLPESRTFTVASKENTDKPHPRMKLKRHRSQLCLQQSFDTITEEEEDHYKLSEQQFEKLETIKGSFNISVDSVAHSVVCKPATQASSSKYNRVVEEESPVENRPLSQAGSTARVSASNNDSMDTDASEATVNSHISKGSVAVLKRQSCEEFPLNDGSSEDFHDSLQESWIANDVDIPAAKTTDNDSSNYISEESLNWEELKSRVEEAERKAFRLSHQDRRKKLHKFRQSISLPVHESEKIFPIRRCITLCVEETETETSESDFSLSTLAGFKLSDKKMLAEERKGGTQEEVTTQQLTAEDNPTPAATEQPSPEHHSPSQNKQPPKSPKSPLTLPKFVIEGDNSQPTETSSISELGEMKSQCSGMVDDLLLLPGHDKDGVPLSPCLSVCSDRTVTPDTTLEFDQETSDLLSPDTMDGLTKRKTTFQKMKSSFYFNSLNDNMRSPFYIVTPKLRYKTRSSSLPLIYRPNLVKSKLRRTVTDNPNTLNNILEEYDADLDDDDLVIEQEEWQNKIYENILRSITSCTKNNEFLKRIEERVEGTSEEVLTVNKRSKRKKTASFSKSGDEVSSSNEDDGKACGNLLEVKPRRRRRKSRERLFGGESESKEDRSRDGAEDQLLDKKEVPMAHSTTPPPGITVCNEERVSDIIRNDEDKQNTESLMHDIESLPEEEKQKWELNVLENVIEHFEQDFAETKRILKEKRRRDLQMRMEIKILKTQIAVHQLQRELQDTKLSKTDKSFHPISASTPMPGKEMREERHQESKGEEGDLGRENSTLCRRHTTLDTFLLNRSRACNTR